MLRLTAILAALLALPVCAQQNDRLTRSGIIVDGAGLQPDGPKVILPKPEVITASTVGEHSLRKIFDQLQPALAVDSTGKLIQVGVHAQRTKIPVRMKVGQHLGGGRYLCSDPDGVLDLGNLNLAEGDVVTGFLQRQDEIYRYVTVLKAERQVAVFKVVDTLPSVKPTFELFKEAIADGREFRIPIQIQARCAECKGERVLKSKTGTKSYCQPCSGKGTITTPHYRVIKS